MRPIFQTRKKSQQQQLGGHELDQSNQPPHRAIWKPPPWPILKVNFDGAIFLEQNYVGVGVVIQDDKG